MRGDLYVLLINIGDGIYTRKCMQCDLNGLDIVETW